MNPREHLEKARRLKGTALKSDDEDDYEMIVQSCFDAAVHIVACVTDTRKKTHLDTHKGLAMFLDGQGLPDIAALVRELEMLRTGRFYGAKGNGKSSKRAKEIIREIEAGLH